MQELVTQSFPPYWWIVFIFGCLGAAAPEIVRLFKFRNSPWKPPSFFYYVISLLFVGLGGMVAVLLPATTLWGAFYVGASLPIIISKIAGEQPPSVQAPPGDVRDLSSIERIEGSDTRRAVSQGSGFRKYLGAL
jgi:hypothetical protein